MAYRKKLINEPRCPFEHALQLFGGKWKARILCLLHSLGTMRFNRISDEMNGISDGVLSGALQELQDAGMISRAVYGEVPPRVEYALTEKGESLIPILRDICLWAQANLSFAPDSLFLSCRRCEHFRAPEKQPGPPAAE